MCHARVSLPQARFQKYRTYALARNDAAPRIGNHRLVCSRATRLCTLFSISFRIILTCSTPCPWCLDCRLLGMNIERGCGTSYRKAKLHHSAVLELLSELRAEVCDTRAPGLLLEHDVLSPGSHSRQVKAKFVSPERQGAWKLCNPQIVKSHSHRLIAPALLWRKSTLLHRAGECSVLLTPTPVLLAILCARGDRVCIQTPTEFPTAFRQ